MAILTRDIQEINIGGAKYQQLANGYILASLNANANGTAVTVQRYLVENMLV